MPLVPRCWPQNTQLLKQEARRLFRALLEVPIYPREFGARPAPLLAPAYQRHFSWINMAEASHKQV